MTDRLHSSAALKDDLVLTDFLRTGNLKTPVQRIESRIHLGQPAVKTAEEIVAHRSLVVGWVRW